MKLFFNKDAVYNGKLLFEAGKEYEVEEKQGFAKRWITRGIAKQVEQKPVQAQPKVEEKKQEAKLPQKNETKKVETKKVEEKSNKVEDIL